eukprot:9962504-Karenia_brevis.AAC.1
MAMFGLNTTIRKSLFYAVTEYGVLFAGFQETRGVSGAKTLHGFYQVVSGVDTQGRESVELWCNVSQPYALLGGRPHFIDVRNVR